MASPKEKPTSKLRATVPPFVPSHVKQLERNRIRREAVAQYMIENPENINRLSEVFPELHPNSNPNIKSARIVHEDRKYISKLVSGLNNMVVPRILPQEIPKVEEIICSGLRISSDQFGTIINTLIQNKNLDVVRRILDCDAVKINAKEYYRHAESFDYSAFTLYHFLDDSMIDIAERLYNLGIDINYRSDSKPGMYTIGTDTIPNFTPIEEAIINVQPGLVKFFIEHGATLPTNPNSLYHAIIPINNRILTERLKRSNIDPNYIQNLQSSINEIYGLVPTLNNTLNVLIVTRNNPREPIIKQTILTRLSTIVRTVMFMREHSYREMINYFITRLTNYGAFENSEIEQRGSSRRRSRITRKRVKAKRSRRILTRRLK